LTKLRIDGINKLKEMRQQILMNLRKIIFGAEQNKSVDSAQESELKEQDKKKIKLNVKFNEDPKDRKDELKDIQLYLDEKAPIDSNTLTKSNIIL
jgi:hypothetical protein